MPIIYWLSTAALVVFLGLLITALTKGRPTSLPAGLLYVTLGTIVGWQAVTWLRAGHPEVSQVQHAAVWVQAIACFGAALLSVVSVWLTRKHANVPMHQLPK